MIKNQMLKNLKVNKKEVDQNQDQDLNKNLLQSLRLMVYQMERI